MSSGALRSTLKSADLKATVAALTQVDRQVATQWRQRARREVAVPWAAQLAAQAPAGTLGRAAGRSISAGTGALPVIWAGKGATVTQPGGSAWQPFYSLEFGRDHGKYSTYVRRSNRGGRGFVRRRTGTWARGRAKGGHWLFPYWRRHDARLTDRVARLLDQVIGEVL